MLQVPPGTPDGGYFIFPGLADQIPGAEAGDVIVVVQENPHKEYRRAGDHLLRTQRIALVDALGGFQISFRELSGKKLTVRPSKDGQVVQPDQVWVLRGRGMPRREGGGQGNLYLRFKIDFPDSLPRENQADAGSSIKAQLTAVLGQKPHEDGSGEKGYFGGYFGGGGGEGAGASVKAEKASKGEQARVARTFGLVESFNL